MPRTSSGHFLIKYFLVFASFEPCLQNSLQNLPCDEHPTFAYLDILLFGCSLFP